MTTPETNPSPPAPESDPAIAALEALKREVRSKTADMLVEALKDSATKARDIEIEVDKKYDPSDPDSVPLTPFEGNPLDPDSTKSKAMSVQKAVREILAAAMEIPPKDFPQKGIVDRVKLDNANRITKIALKQLAEKINPMHITEDLAPYFHKFLFGLLSGQVTSTEELARKYTQVGGKILSISPGMFREFRAALIETVIQYQGFKRTDAEKIFPDINNASGEIRRLLQSPDMNERKIIEVIERDKFAKERLELDKFYANMRTAETFNAYYRDELYAKNTTPDKLKGFEAIIKARKKNIAPDDLKAETIKMAKEATAKDVHQRVIYLVNLFYKPVLAAAPDQQFSQTVNQFGGAYTPSPENMFRQLTSRITGMTTAGVDAAGAGGQAQEKIYMAFHQETKEQVIPQQRTTLTLRNPMKEYEECDFDEFARQLKVIAETERGFMEFGHNFRFATNKGPQGDKGFFETIGQFAKESINTNDIDVITAVEYSELIQIAKMQLERRYKLAFSKMRWQRDIKLFREVFEATNKIDKEIRDSFIRDFAGDAPDKYPEVIIDRCLAHARTLVYGKEFNLQLWASYADPRLEKGGKPTYSREELSGATAFSPVDDAIRWGDIADLNNNGELYLPSTTDEYVDMHDFQVAVAKGKKEFYESFTFGYAAFEKHPPTIAEIGNNLTKGGGMDAIGGYRVRQAYDQWLTGLMDERTNNREINIREGGDDVMVEAWKRVENIGVNIIKNFNSDFILTDTHKNALKNENQKGFKGPKPVTKKYQELFGYWYDRYLGDKESVGNVYVHKKSKDMYVNEMMDKVIKISTLPDNKKGDVLKAFSMEQYKVMTVMLFERSPLEFISMEKPRLTQNGVTLMSQVQNSFIEDRDIKTRKVDGKSLNGAQEFDGATADLVFIEQKARMDTIQQMDEIRKQRKLNGDQFNLYGDKTKQRSEVMQMDGWAKNKKGGYVIDEVYIENVLKEQYKNEKPDVRAWKIERAKRLYKRIQEGMKSRPEHNDEIDIFTGDSPEAAAEMRKKLTKKEAEMKIRMEWWPDAWKDYKMGMTFMSDTADQFMDRSRTGEDTIYQATDNAANTAEVMKKHFLVGMKNVCKQASMERSFKPLYDYLKEIKNPIDSQDGDLAQDMIMLMTKRIITAMRKDGRASGFLGDVYDTTSGRAGSISETYTGEENFNRAWSWDKNDISDFLDGEHGISGGKIIATKDRRDALKKYGHARFRDVFRSHILPLLGTGAIALGLFLAYEGNKEKK